ncbi:hypothetical protein HXX76_002223 [Chlamydomonas incerta]|uniref:Uncharacterized protein n=1 Tax=Chlamydomonas incerta TaxID=51695 RepID=A0A835WAN6_CHLIN|nr:hypothetical protein HXX76_002223 [Chlamydomonas incerta]|eukprot:KAG2443882.1 hypothetical protein HXX76_002223 [Chlamydomonas incerta]
MLIVSTIVMIVSIVIWVVIDAGNRADKQAHQAVLDARLHPRATATSRRSVDLERLTEIARAAAAAANGRDTGGSTGGDMAGDGGAAYSGGGGGGAAYTEKLYFREGAGGGGALRKRMQQL